MEPGRRSLGGGFLPFPPPIYRVREESTTGSPQLEHEWTPSYFFPCFKGFWLALIILSLRHITSGVHREQRHLAFSNQGFPRRRTPNQRRALRLPPTGSLHAGSFEPAEECGPRIVQCPKPTHPKYRGPETSAAICTCILQQDAWQPPFCTLFGPLLQIYGLVQVDE